MSCDPPATLFSEPFYTHPCYEVTSDHARHMILHQYVGCVKIANQWIVPENTAGAWLDLPAVVDVLVGCCIWNPEYGYFLVTAFDKAGQRILIQRKNVPTTSLPGVSVPMCTKFIFTPNI